MHCAVYFIPTCRVKQPYEGLVKEKERTSETCNDITNYQSSGVGYHFEDALPYVESEFVRREENVVKSSEDE